MWNARYTEFHILYNVHSQFMWPFLARNSNCICILCVARKLCTFIALAQIQLDMRWHRIELHIPCLCSNFTENVFSATHKQSHWKSNSIVNNVGNDNCDYAVIVLTMMMTTTTTSTQQIKIKPSPKFASASKARLQAIFVLHTGAITIAFRPDRMERFTRFILCTRFSIRLKQTHISSSDIVWLSLCACVGKSERERENICFRVYTFAARFEWDFFCFASFCSISLMLTLVPLPFSHFIYLLRACVCSSLCQLNIDVCMCVNFVCNHR